MKRPVVMG